MSTVREIYERYRIMPGLQLHQLRVASVAKIICESLRDPINTHDVLLTCLFHDMGNIIKADFSLVGLIKPEDRPLWESVKAEYISTYSGDEHLASNAIGREIGLSDQILDIIDNMRFSRTEWILASAAMEYKVSKYADMRVGPYGILSLTDRLEELRLRYAGKDFDRGDQVTPESLKEGREACQMIEDYIFAQCSIKPEDITDEWVAPIIEELWEYPIA